MLAIAAAIVSLGPAPHVLDGEDAVGQARKICARLGYTGHLELAGLVHGDYIDSTRWTVRFGLDNRPLDVVLSASGRVVWFQRPRRDPGPYGDNTLATPESTRAHRAILALFGYGRDEVRLPPPDQYINSLYQTTFYRLAHGLRFFNLNPTYAHRVEMDPDSGLLQQFIVCPPIPPVNAWKATVPATLAEQKIDKWYGAKHRPEFVQAGFVPGVEMELGYWKFQSRPTATLVWRETHYKLCKGRRIGSTPRRMFVDASTGDLVAPDDPAWGGARTPGPRSAIAERDNGLAQGAAGACGASWSAPPRRSVCGWEANGAQEEDDGGERIVRRVKALLYGFGVKGPLRLESLGRMAVGSASRVAGPWQLSVSAPRGQRFDAFISSSDTEIWRDNGSRNPTSLGIPRRTVQDKTTLRRARSWMAAVRSREPVRLRAIEDDDKGVAEAYFDILRNGYPFVLYHRYGYDFTFEQKSGEFLAYRADEEPPRVAPTPPTLDRAAALAAFKRIWETEVIPQRRREHPDWTFTYKLLGEPRIGYYVPDGARTAILVWLVRYWDSRVIPNWAVQSGDDGMLIDAVTGRSIPTKVVPG